MSNRTAIAGLFIAGVLLVIGRLAADLYGGMTNPIQPNISNDMFSHAFPFYTFVSDSVRSGIFPLWNPYIAVGNSLVGEYSIALFHPTNWTIFILDDVGVAMLVSQILTVLISMSGAYLYSSYLGLKWPARFLCVVLFGYAAIVESFQQLPGATSCWFPLVMYLTHRCFDRPRLANAICLSVALALCFFGGFANYFLYTCLIVGVYFTTLVACSGKQIGFKGITRRFGLMVFSVLAMAGFIAIQLLPASEMSNLSVRNMSEAVTYVASTRWEQVSASLVFNSFLLPNETYVYGNAAMKIDSGLLYLSGAILLVPFAFRNSTYRATAIALTVSGLVILCVVLSAEIAALSFMRDIPVFGSLRMHSRALSYLQFVVILLAVLGASEMASGRQETGNFDGAIARLFWRFFPALFAMAIATAAVAVGRDVLAISGLLACSGLIIYYAIASSRISRPGILASMVVAIIVIDAGIHRQSRFQVPAFNKTDYTFARESAIDYKNNRDHYRMLLVATSLEQVAPWANSGMILGTPSISAYDPFVQSRWQNFIRSMTGPEKFDSMVANSILGIFYGDLTNLLKPLSADDRILGMASLRYIYSPRGNTVNEQALPRAYAVHRYIKTQNEEQSLAAIKANIAHLRESVILENAEPGFAVLDRSDDGSETQGRVEIVRYTPNEVELSVDVSHPAMVVLTDSFYPGWVAYVNGRETPIFRANSLFRAVEVPAGSHSVDFRFRPGSFYMGATITLFTICFALVLVTTTRYFGKRRRARQR